MLTVSIILATLAFLRNVTGEPFLKLTSDGPVVLDATITFKAQLFGAQEYEPPYYFTFSKLFRLEIGSYQLIFTSYYSSLKNKNDLFQVMMPVLGTGMNSPVIPLM